MQKLYMVTGLEGLGYWEESKIPFILVDKNIKMPKETTKRIKYDIQVDPKDILDLTDPICIRDSIKYIFNILSTAQITFNNSERLKDDIVEKLSSGQMFFSDIGSMLIPRHLFNYMIAATPYILDIVWDVENKFLNQHIIKTLLPDGEDYMYRTTNIELLEILEVYAY